MLPSRIAGIATRVALITAATVIVAVADPGAAGGR